jgi:hypothetical protein
MSMNRYHNCERTTKEGFSDIYLTVHTHSSPSPIPSLESSWCGGQYNRSNDQSISSPSSSQSSSHNPSRSKRPTALACLPHPRRLHFPPLPQHRSTPQWPGEPFRTNPRLLPLSNTLIPYPCGFVANNPRGLKRRQASPGFRTRHAIVPCPCTGSSENFAEECSARFLLFSAQVSDIAFSSVRLRLVEVMWVFGRVCGTSVVDLDKHITWWRFDFGYVFLEA